MLDALSPQRSLSMSSTGITLFATDPMFGLPDSSPFVIKTEIQLKMAGLAYDKVSTTPPQAPNGKLPYINDHDEVVTDSTFIRAHIEHKYGRDLDQGLDARQRAQAWTIERLLETRLRPQVFSPIPSEKIDEALYEGRRHGRGWVLSVGLFGAPFSPR